MDRHLWRSTLATAATVAVAGLLTLGSGAAQAVTISGAPSAGASAQTTTLPAGETVTHEANGVTLYTAPMKFVPTSAGHTAISNGYGQQPAGVCGVAKLWTYASSQQFQLSLIDSPGVFLGLGSYEFTTNALFSLPVFGVIEGKGLTWTSGRMDVPYPGLRAQVGFADGIDATSIGDCIISVVALWN